MKSTENGTFCQDTCGNKNMFDQEECDLGKGIALDGCTDVCKIEDDFKCSNASDPMICSYFGTFQIEILKKEKLPNENKIEMEFRISPLLYAFQKVEIANLISFNDSAFQNPEFTFSSATGTLKVTTAYTKDL